MDTIQEIKLAIKQLPPDDLTRLRDWFDELEAQLWEEQLKADIQAGKLDAMATQALSDFRANRCQEL